MARSKLLLATPSIPYSANLYLYSSISYGNIIKNELNLNDASNSNSLPYTDSIKQICRVDGLAKKDLDEHTYKFLSLLSCKFCFKRCFLISLYSCEVLWHSGRSTLPSFGRTGAYSPFVSTFLINICYHLNSKDMLQNDTWLWVTA